MTQQKNNYIWIAMTLQVDILNPKATKLLQNLADRKLIAIKEDVNNPFVKAITRLRKKASANPPSSEKISKEVELVRAKRYAGKKR